MTRGSSSLGSPGMSQGNRCGTAQMAGERCGRCEQRETESGGSPLETEGLSFIYFLCYLFMLCHLYMNMFIRLIVLRLEGRVRLRGRPLHAWRIRPPRSLRRSRVWLMIWRFQSELLWDSLRHTFPRSAFPTEVSLFSLFVLSPFFICTFSFI